MKKIIGLVILTLFLFAGCGTKTPKLEGSYKTIEDDSQSVVTHTVNIKKLSNNIYQLEAIENFYYKSSNKTDIEKTYVEFEITSNRPFKTHKNEDATAFFTKDFNGQWSIFKNGNLKEGTGVKVETSIKLVPNKENGDKISVALERKGTYPTVYIANRIK